MGSPWGESTHLGSGVEIGLKQPYPRGRGRGKGKGKSTQEAKGPNGGGLYWFLVA